MRLVLRWVDCTVLSAGGFFTLSLWERVGVRGLLVFVFRIKINLRHRNIR